jgi:polyisoprenoid-binding protein YceI
MAPSGQLTTSSVQKLLQDAALAGDWSLDASRSTVGLKSTSMWGLAPVKGVFRQVTGDGTVTADGKVSGTIRVAAASIDTKINRRDKHLRSKDFFDVDNFQDIIFMADGAAPSGHGVTVTGTLTVRDRSRPLSFPAKVSVPGRGEVWLDAEIQINRADFGLTWSQLGMASMSNTINVHAVFRRR